MLCCVILYLNQEFFVATKSITVIEVICHVWGNTGLNIQLLDHHLGSRSLLKWKDVCLIHIFVPHSGRGDHQPQVKLFKRLLSPVYCQGIQPTMTSQVQDQLQTIDQHLAYEQEKNANIEKLGRRSKN